MPPFSAYDGTALAYHVFGDGDGRDGGSAGHSDRAPLICLPGGPQDSAYLGELGGLSAHRQLVVLDFRGTGKSATPADLASCRCDRLVDDVEALREQLGSDRVDVLGHSGGANVAVQYAARHPERVGRLVLVTPSTRAVGIEITAGNRTATARLRKDEPWFPAAYAALEDIVAGRGTADSWQAVAPFTYGRWDAAARAHEAAGDGQRSDAVTEAFGAEGAFDPGMTRAALAAFAAPVLLVAGQVDLAAPPPVMAEVAALFPHAELAVQQGAGHFPWLDDPERFVAVVAGFLA